ncbi:hypothetical protein EGW08_017707, partial [Elysia chlorotica]
MYKHRKKLSKDESGDSSRPSTSNSGRSSQISNSSSKTTSRSTNNETKLQSDGHKDISPGVSTNAVSYGEAGGVSAGEIRPKSKEIKVKTKQIDGSETGSGKGKAAEVPKDLGKESSTGNKADNKQVTSELKSVNLDSKPVASQQSNIPQQLSDKSQLMTSQKMKVTSTVVPSPTPPPPSLPQQVVPPPPP